MEEIAEAMEERSCASDFVSRYRGSKIVITVFLELEILISN